MQPILKQKLKVNYKQLRKEKGRKCISSVWVTTCFRPSLGSDSDTSSGRTDTSAIIISISTFYCETLPMFKKPPAEKGKIQAVLLSKHCKLSELLSKYCKLSDKKKQQQRNITNKKINPNNITTNNNKINNADSNQTSESRQRATSAPKSPTLAVPICALPASQRLNPLLKKTWNF